MKKQLLFLVLMMLPVVASAITEIDGIYYNLNSGTQTAEVIPIPAMFMLKRRRSQRLH